MGKIRNNSGLLINAFSYILPIQIFSGVVLFLHSLVDSILVGRFLGENNLAIIGLTAPIGLTITFIGCVISNGFQILCGNAIGRGEKNNINATFSNAIVLSFIFGIIAALFCAAFSGNISSWVGINNIQMERAFKNYLLGMCFGFPFSVFFQSMLSFLELDSARRFAFFSTLMMIASKIIFDIVSIFLLHNGMFGIGLATSCSYYVAVAAGLVCFFVKCKSFRFSKKFISVSMSLSMIIKGFSGGLQTLSSIIFCSVLNSLAMHYGGAQGVSVLAATMNTSDLLLGIVTASFTTASVIITVFAGSRDYLSIKKTCSISIISSWILTAVSFTLLLFVSDSFAHLFGLSGESSRLAAYAMKCFVLCGFTCWGKLLNLSVYKSMGMVKKASIWCFISLILIPCTSSIILCSSFGLDGFWYAYITENTVSMVVALILCSVKLKRLPHSIHEWIYLPSEINNSSVQRLEMTLKNSEDVVAISEKTIAFCKQCGIDGKKGFLSGLCVEELADNVFQHNSTSAGKLSVEFRAIAGNGKLSIVLCDNGRQFNPKEYLEMMKGLDAVDNIGMKIISKTAENISYTAPFGLNMLFIEI